MFICSCFGITEAQVRQHAESGARTPRQIAGACKAGTDCGSCVRRIQSVLGRGGCARTLPTPAEMTGPLVGTAGPVVPMGQVEPAGTAATLAADAA